MEQIGSLISDVHRLMKRSFDQRARAIGVTRQQWLVLVKLHRHEGINQGGLADLCDVEPITLCRMVDRLAEAGHVERRRDPRDRRAWNIYLTERSRPLIAQLHAIADDVFSLSLEGLDTGERTLLVTLLARVRQNLSSSSNQDNAAHG